jgi:hypothetical protein
VPEEGKTVPAYGFAGLSAMVSNVDEMIAQAAMEGSHSDATSSKTDGTRSSSGSQQIKQTATDHQRYQQPPQRFFRISSPWVWLLCVIGVIGAFGVFSSGPETGVPSASISQPQSPNQQYLTDTEVFGPSASIKRTQELTQSTPPSVFTPGTPVSPKVTEEKPPVGTKHMLGPAEIRYCLSEHIRIDAARGVLNHYVKSDVNRFNAAIADYNSRCGEFLYKPGSLETARSKVESNRAALEAVGRSRFIRNSSANVTDTSEPNPFDQFDPKKASQPQSVLKRASRPQPDPTVLAIQRRLKKLGYGVGAVDGLYGPKTRTAIIAFQEDKKIATDGVANVSFLKRLNAAKRPNPRPRTDFDEQSHHQPAQAATPIARPSHKTIEGMGKLDLLAVSVSERHAIERVCESARIYSSPTDYHNCLSSELYKLHRSGGMPDMSKISTTERSSIKHACASDRQFFGPGDYYDCLNEELNKLRYR